MHRITTASLLAAATVATLNPAAMAITLSNEVANGQILVDFLDPSEDRRLGWESVTPFPSDEDVVVPLLSIGSISIAHDSNNFYFRMIMDSTADPVADPVDGPFQSFFSSHHAIYLDTDQNPNTGYRGGDGDTIGTPDDRTLPIGADYYIEGPTLFRFGNLSNPGGANQELFTWGTIIPFGFMNYDDGPVTDIEFEIPKSSLASPTAFDFVAVTTNIDFSPQDVYPTSPDEPLLSPLGDFLSYSTVAVSLPGDFDNSGVLDAPDVELLIAGFGNSAFDLDGDNDADSADIAYWVETLYGSSIGDANLDFSVDLIDLSALASAFSEPGAYADADFDGSGVVDLIDLSLLATNFGFSGTPAPEPASLAILGLGVAALARRRTA
ncbi:MAG: PEP-CTERM sorting domain-containing protein [Phycisphaeraceae bacterium]